MAGRGNRHAGSYVPMLLRALSHHNNNIWSGWSVAGADGWRAKRQNTRYNRGGDQSQDK